MITGRQIRHARALLQWSHRGLASRAGVDERTVKRAEYVDEEPSITQEHGQAIRLALEAAGVEFIPENGGGAGVRLKK